MLHAPGRLWSYLKGHSSCNYAFSDPALDVICVQELLHGGSNFYGMCLYRKMSSVKQLNLCVRQIFPKRLCSSGEEKGIVLPPDRKQRWSPFTKIFLKFRIEVHIRRVIQKQIELNLFVPWTFQQSRIQCVRLRRNTLGIRYPVRVLPARSFQCQNILANYLAIFRCGSSPVFPDRSPGIGKAFLVSISVL